MEIYIEECGGGMGEIFLHLYTVNKSCEEGHGIQFSSIGEPCVFAWCNPSEENKLPEDLKRKFMYSFKHGSTDIHVKSELLKDGADLWEILRDESKYTYDWVSRKDAAIQRKIEALEINTKEDVIKHKDLLFDNPISHGVVCKVLLAYGLQPTVAHNGEIGIAEMYDFAKFLAIKESLSNGLLYSNRGKGQIGVSAD